MAKHYGKCALCGQHTELTYEHVPPRTAFNWFPQKTYTGNSVIEAIADHDRMPWDVTNLKYNNAQRGMGGYTLCHSCNNLTGVKYGKEYVKFARGFHYVMQKENPLPGMTMHIQGASFRPLPVLKQISSMFCSLHKDMENNRNMDRLRKFVLDEKSTDFPKEHFKLGMYLFAGGLMRRCPITGMCFSGSDGFKMEIISEITTYPVGFLLYFDPDQSLKMPCADITDFCNFTYDQECQFEFFLPIYECNSMVPADFRTRQEIGTFMEENEDQDDDAEY